MVDIECWSGRPSLAVEVSFPAGLPGFPHAHRFELAPGSERETPFLTLRAIDDLRARFVVVSPWAFFPDYEFALREEDAARLGIDEARAALVFCMVTLCAVPRRTTVNLLGPIVVNRRTLEAAQVVVPVIGYGVRAPLAVAS
jgi:flagellar assembly factor FliW